MNGTTRTTILIGNLAFKIPKLTKNHFYNRFQYFLQGWLSNLNENIWYNSEIYDYLCPVKFSFYGLVLIMPRTTPITVVEFSKLTRSDYFGAVEWKRDSFGKLNNKIVIVDYG